MISPMCTSLLLFAVVVVVVVDVLQISHFLGDQTVYLGRSNLMIEFCFVYSI